MKLFQKVQQNFLLTYGIGLDQHPFNWKNLLGFLIFCSGIVSICEYFFCEAEAFEDYSNSIAVCVALIAATVAIVIVSSNTNGIFGCVRDAEKIIDDSKLATFFFPIKS